MTKLGILVLGYIVRRPLGGGTWPTLQYALGLKRLGHDVSFLEDSEDYASCYDPSRHVTDENPKFGLRYAEKVFNRVGLGDAWAYHDAHRNRWHGPLTPNIARVCHGADLLINVSGINPIRPWLENVPTRIYIDTDPAFEQVRQLTDRFRQERAAQHNVFFTLGENIPAGAAKVPDDGIDWRATRQPVVLEQWPVKPAQGNRPFTTVMLWDSYPPREYQEFRFGMKSESFAPFIDLPNVARGAKDSATPSFELALGSPNAPRKELRKHGWQIRDPLELTRDPWVYQKYIQSSRARVHRRETWLRAQPVRLVQ